MKRSGDDANPRRRYSLSGVEDCARCRSARPIKIDELPSEERQRGVDLSSAQENQGLSLRDT